MNVERSMYRELDGTTVLRFTIPENILAQAPHLPDLERISREIMLRLIVEISGEIDQEQVVDAEVVDETPSLPPPARRPSA